MDYTWGFPAGSAMPKAWPYYQYPQQIPGFDHYHMSQPWMAGYMPMYPYGGYYPEMGSQKQQHVDMKPFHENVKSHEDVPHSPNAKRRRLDETTSDPITYAESGLLEQQEYPKSTTRTDTVPSPCLEELGNSICSSESTSSTTTSPVPVIEEQGNSNDSSQMSHVLDSTDQNVENSNTENSQDSFYFTQNQSFNHSNNGNETTYDHSYMHQNQSFNQSYNSENIQQNQQRADSSPESDTSVNSFGNQLQESLMVVLPDGSKTALMDLQLSSAPFANYQPPQQGTFVFSAPAVPSTGKVPRSRHSSGSATRGSGNNYCHLCNKSYESKYKLKLHMHAHTGERPFVCEVCGKGFTRGPNLNAHMRVHTGVKPFSCTRCNRGFSHPSDRVIHMVTEVCLRAGRILRKVTDGWECTICDSGVMEDKEHAERHARQHEAGKGLFCPVCRTSYQGQKAHVLVKHVRENHPEYLLACGV